MVLSATRLVIIGICCCFLTLFSGCGKDQKGPPREATYPIQGVVEIDGLPEQQVKVLCHPVQGSALPGSAYTDADGKFSMGTYEAGDGVKAGKYKLTFAWGQINLMSGRYEGDKLNERYSDPEKSEFTVTVAEGKENDLGVISLTSD